MCKKLALIDGAAFGRMSQELGIRMVAAQPLYAIIRYEIGSICIFSEPPVLTMRPDLGGSESRLANAFRRRGFNAIPATSHNEADDRIIISKIEDAKRPEVSEIVLFASDHCYIEPLLEKVAQGIAVFWVVSDTGDGRSRIGKELRKYLGKEFRHIDLMNFAKKIEFRERRAY